MNLKVYEEHAVQPSMSAQQRIKTLVHEHGVKSTATNWPVLRECGQEPLQKKDLRLPFSRVHYGKSLAMTHTDRGHLFSTPATRIRPGDLPLAVALLALDQGVLDLNSETLRRVLEAESHLADRDDSCWSAHVSKAFSGMRNEDMWILGTNACRNLSCLFIVNLVKAG
eukprot:1148431-Pelagomonas_calceolata.AAC.1